MRIAFFAALVEGRAASNCLPIEICFSFAANFNPLAAMQLPFFGSASLHGWKHFRAFADVMCFMAEFSSSFLNKFCSIELLFRSLTGRNASFLEHIAALGVDAADR